MIDRKYSRVVFAFFMALCMSCVMSGVISFINLGGASGFFLAWMKAWCVGFTVAFPCVLLFVPVATRLAELFLKDK